jgi:hypothetical protein
LYCSRLISFVYTTLLLSVKNYVMSLPVVSVAFICKRENCGLELTLSNILFLVIAELLSAPLVWFRQGGIIPPLQLLYDGPYAFLRPSPSPSESGCGMRWLPSAVLRPAQQRTPCLAAHHAAADHRACAQVVLPPPSGSRFQTHWFLHLLLLLCRHKTVPEPFSYPARRCLHTQDRRCLHILHRHSTCPVNGHSPRGWTSNLFSLQPRPELGGSPVESWLHLW